MKTLKRLLFFIAGIYLLLACSKSDRLWGDDFTGLKYSHEKDNNPIHGLDQDRYISMKSIDLKVHYRIIGKGPIDIVFIPGWTNPLEIFTKQFDYFRDKARCIYVDVPGQGLSDAPEGIDYTMGLMVDAIYEVVKKEGLKKFVAVGFSMGPLLLGQFELKHPGMITKLVNLDGGFTPWPPVGDPNRQAYIDGLNDFNTYLFNSSREDREALLLTLVPETAPDDLKAFVTYFYDFPNWLMVNIVSNVNREDVNQPIGWTFPILSIYTAEPTDMAYEQLYFPNADIHVITGSGHVVQWEKHEIVNPLIWEFVSDSTRKSAPVTFVVLTWKRVRL